MSLSWGTVFSAQSVNASTVVIFFYTIDQVSIYISNNLPLKLNSDSRQISPCQIISSYM